MVWPSIDPVDATARELVLLVQQRGVSELIKFADGDFRQFPTSELRHTRFCKILDPVVCCGFLGQAIGSQC